MTLKYKKIAFISLFIFATNTSLAKEPPSSSPSNILIEENGISITAKEALLMLEDMTASQKKRILSDQEKFKNLITDLFILKKKASAAKVLKLDKDPVIQWKIENKKERILSSELSDHFSENLKTPENIKSLAKEYYDSHPEEFLIQESVQVAHILIKTMPSDKKEEKLTLAKNILKEINEGLDFYKAAKEYSEDTGSLKTDGKLNQFTRGKMVKPFEEAAFNLKESGDISDIVQTRYGYHIIKLIQHNKASTQPFEQVESMLVAQQKKKYISTKTKSYLNEFNLNAKSTIHMPALEKIRSEATLAIQSAQQ